MARAADFIAQLEAKVAEQLGAQRIGYLLGAGSSYLNGQGYPLAFELWDLIKGSISDATMRADIQAKLDGGANGVEHALDLLDDGGAKDTPYRHLVVSAVADFFMRRAPTLDVHEEFVRRVAHRADPSVKVFSLNYDPLIERAAVEARTRVIDGFLGAEDCFFDAAVFEERTGQIRGTHRSRVWSETIRPVHLLKLHGSLGWYEHTTHGARRGAFGSPPPLDAKRLMIPPQRRKATDTMLPPYSALWSVFRDCLAHSATPLNRLACLGYGFADVHVNDVIEAALTRTDFTVLIFTKTLPTPIWDRWSTKHNVIVVTETRCSIKGLIGPGHADLWSFERIAKEV